MKELRRQRDPVPALLLFAGLSLVLHVLLLAGLDRVWDRIVRLPEPEGEPVPVRLVLVAPEEPEPEREPEPPDLRGQIIDLPRPEKEEVPDEADYLAEHARKVPEETRTRRFRVNPEVLAPTYSREDRLEFQDLIDLNVHEPSTGARAGDERFDPDRDGRLAMVPSPFLLTNREGLQKPVPAATRSQEIAGAPNNDLLDEKVGDAVALNTREFLGAAYINRIRRLVNFYWKQNLDNLPASVRFSKSRYRTVVHVVLDANGALERIEVAESSGSEPLDRAVVDAFRIAGPFPNPPEQLVSPDGRVRLPDMGFTVELGHARAAFMGVDPRAGVQFPGILKVPR